MALDITTIQRPGQVKVPTLPGTERLGPCEHRARVRPKRLPAQKPATPRSAPLLGRQRGKPRPPTCGTQMPPGLFTCREQTQPDACPGRTASRWCRPSAGGCTTRASRAGGRPVIISQKLCARPVPPKPGRAMSTLGCVTAGTCSQPPHSASQTAGRQPAPQDGFGETINMSPRKLETKRHVL